MNNKNSRGQLVELTVGEQGQLDHLANMQAQANVTFSDAGDMGNAIFRTQQILDRAQVIGMSAPARHSQSSQINNPNTPLGSVKSPVWLHG